MTWHGLEYQMTIGEVKHLRRSDSESDSEADSCPILVTESTNNRPQNRQGLTDPILRTILSMHVTVVPNHDMELHMSFFSVPSILFVAVNLHDNFMPRLSSHQSRTRAHSDSSTV